MVSVRMDELMIVSVIKLWINEEIQNIGMISGYCRCLVMCCEVNKILVMVVK